MALKQIIYVKKTESYIEFDLVDDNMDQYVARIFRTRGTTRQLADIFLNRLGLKPEDVHFVEQLSD